MTELLDLTELETLWKQSKSSLGRQMFELAQIRRDMRALHHKHEFILALPEDERKRKLPEVLSAQQGLIARRRELRNIHQPMLETHKVLLTQLERGSHKTWSSRARRKTNSLATAQVVSQPSPDQNYGRSGHVTNS